MKMKLIDRRLYDLLQNQAGNHERTASIIVVVVVVVEATGGDTGAGADFGDCNKKVGFGERISTGVAIGAGDGDGAETETGAGTGAGGVAGEGTGTETGATAGAADTIGLLGEGFTGTG